MKFKQITKKNLWIFLSGLITSIILSNTNTITFAFSDVSQDHQNYEAINYLQDAGIIQGYEDGNFKPENQVTRAEFLKMLLELYYPEDNSKIASSDNPTDCFTDSADHWAANYICHAMDLGFVEGYALEGSYQREFRPNNSITFPEAAKIIVEVSGEKTYTSSKKHWAQKYLDTLGQSQAIPSSVNNLQAPITRAELAEIIWRLKEEVQDKDASFFVNFDGNGKTHTWLNKYYRQSESGDIYYHDYFMFNNDKNTSYLEHQLKDLDLESLEIIEKPELFYPIIKDNE